MIDESYMEAWNGIGNAFISHERYEEAMENFNQVIASDTETKDAWKGKAKALEKIQRIPEANEYYRRSIEYGEEMDDSFFIQRATDCEEERIEQESEVCLPVEIFLTSVFTLPIKSETHDIFLIKRSKLQPFCEKHFLRLAALCGAEIAYYVICFSLR